MIIDFHCHLEYFDDGRMVTPKEIVEAMDEYGIDKSVLIGNDQADAGSLPPWANPKSIGVDVNRSDAFVASFVTAYPDRFVGFTSVHPDRYQPERKVERAILDYGMRGVKLFPHSGFYPNDPRLYLVYEKCMAHNVPVMIHTGIKPVRWQSIKYNDPMYVDDVALKFPELTIVMCHCGYPWVEQFLCVAHSNPNIMVDLTFLDYIEAVYQVDNLTENCVRRLNALIGAKRMLWGTEGPFMRLPAFGGHEPAHYRTSMESLVGRFDFLTPKDKADILGENARRLLRL